MQLDRAIDLAKEGLEKERDGALYDGGFYTAHEGYAVLQEALDVLWVSIKNTPHKEVVANIWEAYQTHRRN